MYAYEEADIQARPSDIVQRGVGRNLHQDISNEQCRQSNLVLRVAEAQIVLQSLESSGSIIVSRSSLSATDAKGSQGRRTRETKCLPVDIVHEIDKNDNRHNEPINLLLQLLLDLELSWRQLHQMVPRLQVDLLVEVEIIVVYVLGPGAILDLVVRLHLVWEV